MSSAKAMAFAFHQWETLDEDALPTTARTLLMALANFCNEHFETYPSRGKLAKLCSCSLDTVDRQLRHLERAGLIARIRRERFNGASTSATNILLIGPAQVEHAKALGWKPPGADPQDVVGGPHHAALPQEPEGGRTMRLGGPHHAAPVITEPKNSEHTPLAPQPAEAPPSAPADVTPALGVGVVPEGGRRRLDPDFAGADAFLAAWPAPAVTDSPEAVRRLWARLTPDDRKAAAARAGDWRAKARASGQRSFSACRYLRDKLWQAIDVAKASEKAGISPPTTFVFEGSDAWKAWCEHRRRRDGIGSYPVVQRREDGRRGWWFPTLWPPRPEAQAGPDAAGESEAQQLARSHADFAAANGLG